MDKESPSNRARSAYELRISIADIKPQIWRTVRVPDDYTLGELHYVLQVVFSWDNGHMHSFTVNSTDYGMVVREKWNPNNKYEIVDEDTVCLYELSLQPKQKFTYLYDFGDSWLHEITVSGIVPIGPENAEMAWLCCLGGSRAGPLEDSGGPWGYADMLEILSDPGRKEYEDIHEWAGDFDPEYFNLEETNARLEQLLKRGPK
jgi:hypothetical protein